VKAGPIKQPGFLNCIIVLQLFSLLKNCNGNQIIERSIDLLVTEVFVFNVLSDLRVLQRLSRTNFPVDKSVTEVYRFLLLT
jgi:hypothetical protein